MRGPGQSWGERSLRGDGEGSRPLGSQSWGSGWQEASPVSLPQPRPMPKPERQTPTPTLHPSMAMWTGGQSPRLAAASVSSGRGFGQTQVSADLAHPSESAI